MATGHEDDPHFGTAYFHQVEITVQSGDIWKVPRWCPGTDDLECDLCDNGERRAEQFGIWCWVYQIYRHNQNPDAEKNPDQAWKKVRIASTNEVVFKQIVNGPVFWQRGFGQGQSLWQDLVACYRKDGDLTLQDYEIERRGQGLQTSWTIVPTGNRREVPEGVAAVKPKLPATPNVLAGKAKWPAEGEQVDVEGAEEEIPIEETTPVEAPAASRLTEKASSKPQEPTSSRRSKAPKTQEPEPEVESEGEPEGSVVRRPGDAVGSDDPNLLPDEPEEDEPVEEEVE